MKKKIMILAVGLMAAALSFHGCGEAEVPDVSGQKYLSIDVSQAADSPTNGAVYREAIKRMDPYVDFRNGEYRLKRVTPAKLNMSEDLFAELQAMMQQSNDMLKEISKERRLVEIRPNVIRAVDPREEIPLLVPRTRGLGEDPYPPDSNGVDWRWYGYDLYLSNSSLISLSNYSNGISGAATVAALLGGGIPAGVAAGVEVMLGAYYAEAAHQCPNGAVMRYYWPLLGPITTIANYVSIECQ